MKKAKIYTEDFEWAPGKWTNGLRAVKPPENKDERDPIFQLYRIRHNVDNVCGALWCIFILELVRVIHTW